MNDPFDFYGIMQDAKRDGAAARMMAADGVAPVKGGVYTVSADFVCGDRSYMRSFWEVLAIIGTNALVKLTPEPDYCDGPMMMQIDVRNWYDATDAFAAYNASCDAS